MTRDVKEIPGVLNGMAAAVTPGRNAGVFAATKVAENIAKAEGGVYRLTGRRRRGGGAAKKVRLTATSNVREFNTAAGGRNVVGLVKASPVGFWSIVEQGRRGGYVIVNRDAVAGRRGEKAPAKFVYAGEPGKAYRSVRPDAAGPQGSPWKRTVVRARTACPREFERVYPKPIVAAFKGETASPISAIRRAAR